MKKGTKSLLFGVHQFIWHPVVVLLAWIELYGLPNWKELLCIIIHDWGYWGCENMDDEKGQRHTEFAAMIICKLLNMRKISYNYDEIPPFNYESTCFYNLCLLHSRHYAKSVNCRPSKLCYADKLSMKYEIRWLYLLRGKLSSEVQEYKHRCVRLGYLGRCVSYEDWFDYVQKKCITIGKAQDVNVGSHE